MNGANGRSLEKARSACDKEKTKLRERQRRSVTTKIFNGLRKHGNYNLAPRADINDVLRALAMEAGWVVEPDGTTYRANKVRQAASWPFDGGAPQLQQCPTCSVALGNCNRAITTSSIVGDCSTNASPRHVSLHQQPSSSSGEGGSLGPTSASRHFFASASSSRDGTVAIAGTDVASEWLLSGAHMGHVGYGGPHAVLPHHVHAFLQEARASNQNTPIGSPQRHYG